MSNTGWMFLFGLLAALVNAGRIVAWIQTWGTSVTGDDRVWMSRRNAYIIAGLVFFSLIPSGIGLLGNIGAQDDEPVKRYITEWGRSEIPDRVMIKTRGGYFRSKRSSYRLAMVCFPYYGVGDPIDTVVYKSDLRDIVEAEIEVTAQFPRSFLAPGIEVKTTINYVLLLVPNGVTMDQFSTLRQAIALGVKQLQMVGGPN